jgi:mRNA-degrading endonuclease RelE of RelBE toxin-antitoxin system
MKSSPTAGASILKGTKNRLWRKKLGDLRIVFAYEVKARRVLIVDVELRQKDTYDDIEKWLNDVEK